MPPPALDRHDAAAMPALVAHGFTGRHGGVSTGTRASLTLAAAEGVAAEALAENWRRALSAVHGSLTPAHLAIATQVHGRAVAVVTEPTGPHRTVGEADALVTTVPGLAVAVRVADCVPVLLAAPGGVAAVHAGWRGVAAGIVAESAAALAHEARVALTDITAVVGPHIHAEAYEVGPEVIAGVMASGVPRDVVAVPVGASIHADLGASVRHQLAELGIASTQVGGCSSSPAYFSYRHDGSDTGRQAGIIARVVA